MAEKDIKEMAEKVNDLCGITESETGLAAPSQWELVSDKMMQEERPLQAAGDAGSVTEFVDILLAPFKIGDRGREWDLQCEGLLQQARSLLDPSVPSGKELVDLVGVDLPSVVVQYSGVSKECQESSTLLIQDLATAFDPPREIFTAFCEVINMYSKPETIHLCLPLVRGLSLVFPRIRRRTAEFFKEAVPGLLELGRTGQSEADEYSGSSEDIGDDPSNLDRHLLLRVHFGDNIQNQVMYELIHLAKGIKGICDGVQKMERLRDVLGIFALQLLTMTGAIKSDSTNAVPDGELEIMQLVSFSSISLSALVSTAEVDKIFDMVFDEEDAQAQENRLETKRGAALAAFWAIQMDKASTISVEITGLKEKFEAPGRQMVLDIIGLASTLLSPVSDTLDISFVLKGLAVMTYILELYCASSKNDDASQLDDGVDISIQIRPALQTLQDVIVSIPSPMLRRQAYGVLIKVISEVLPTRARFSTLYSLISRSCHPSLVSLLLTCVKDEAHKCWPKHDAMQKVEQNVNKDSTSSLSPFTSREVLQFIQCVLRTKHGEIVELPANLDAVLGALNLYRYLLIRESAGGTNYTRVLSSDELVKGRTYWLLPLREQILRVQDELKSGGTDSYQDVQLAMDYTKDVLYRCLEIVEQLSGKPLT